MVALRKESVDRNVSMKIDTDNNIVALRKESVDRNSVEKCWAYCNVVALRKESVDRNCELPSKPGEFLMSLSARRAWIEMFSVREVFANFEGRSPQGERG